MVETTFGDLRLPAAKFATRHGRLPDDGIIDTVAVDLAAQGHHPRLTSRELICTVYKLTKAGYVDREIAERVRMNERNVVAMRRRYGIKSVYASSVEAGLRRVPATR